MGDKLSGTAGRLSVTGGETSGAVGKLPLSVGRDRTIRPYLSISWDGCQEAGSRILAAGRSCPLALWERVRVRAAGGAGTLALSDAPAVGYGDR